MPVGKATKQQTKPKRPSSSPPLFNTKNQTLKMTSNFTTKPTYSNTYNPARTDLDQMPDTPTRGARHRRALSDTFFSFPDLDDIPIDDVVPDFNLDVLYPNGSAQPNKEPGSRPPAHLRSLSVDADFFDGLGLDGPPAPEVGPVQRHKRSSSMDGYSSATSSDVESAAKKAMSKERIAELALIDPKKAKRILANRLSAARSKERKVRYTHELERKVQMLQTEATTLSAQITLLQRDTTGLTTENKELKLKLQAIEQQAHLKDALNEALKNELERLRIAAGQIPAVNGNNRGFSSQYSARPPTFHNFGNHHAAQQQQQQQQQQQRQPPFHMPHSASSNPRLNAQSQPSFQNFNQRA